jgi:hypothetical protein
MNPESNNQVFEYNIKQWIQLDNQLKVINEQSKGLREKRNELETTITNYATTNNLSKSTINISNSKLKFANTRVAEPLTFKYLEKSLGQVIKNETQVTQIMEHIKGNREIKIVPEIKRF